ncbi:General transcription factor IIF subunit 2 [Holothuria leucospilota]|uniref:General transcription factor IIF subunit 2 n=1 Tax=Holothuria leucospilota TaxID=206669 RepID=A0A9Q1BHE3_HOLLE|nr:General transcription factor IIF subunit 2 [Holothuria leucospilota]
MNDRTDVDITGANSNVMLVKVPKYISKRWEKVGPGGAVGKLRVSSKLNKRDFTFILKQDLANLILPDDDVKIPQEYKFHTQVAANRTAVVFSENSGQAFYSVTEQSSSSSGDGSTSMTQTKISLEGQVAERAECRPVGGDNYMKMKRYWMLGRFCYLFIVPFSRLQIRNALQPQRTTKAIDKRPIFKPTSNRTVNTFFDKKKKSDEGKKARLERDQVMDMLFKAFEKHQYYSFKDLVQITQQPSVSTLMKANTCKLYL